MMHVGKLASKCLEVKFSRKLLRTENGRKLQLSQNRKAVVEEVAEL